MGAARPSAVLLAVLAVPLCAAAPAAPDPAAVLEGVYAESDPDALQRLFDRERAFLDAHAPLFDEALEELQSHNDSWDPRRRAEELSVRDRAVLAVRTLSRVVFRLADLDREGRRLEAMHAALRPRLSSDWRAARYLGDALYASLASAAPERLEAMLEKDPGLPRPGAALLALLRRGRPAPQAAVAAMLARPLESDEAVQLLFYLDDPRLKLESLERRLEELRERPYLWRCWREREILNALASFPEGLRRLEELRASGAVGLLEVDGVFYGTLKGSGLSLRDLGARKKSLRAASRLIRAANEAFGGRERVRYVDITPDEVDGQRMNSAGWGDGALYATIGDLRDSSARAFSFGMLHEACEQKFDKGVRSTALAATYFRALRGTAVDLLRLGRRIGGSYAETGLGHPWDGEKEWFAESASAVLIGEGLPPETRPALAAARALMPSLR